MKRLLMIVLCITMLLPGGIPATAAGQAEDSGRYGLLAALGLAGWEASDSDGKTPLTRGELARIAAVLNGADAQTAGRDIYKDVTEERSDYGYITACYDGGYLKGFPGDVFRPDARAAKDDLVRIVMDALGYGGLIAVQGGGRTAYLNMASRCKLRIPAGNGEVSRADAAAFLLDALETEMAEATEIRTGGELWYQTARTLMEVRFSVFRQDGILTDDGLSSLTGASQTTRGHAVVGGLLLDDPRRLCEEKLGFEVEAYYYEQSYDGRELIFITEGRHSTHLTLTDEEFLGIDAAGTTLSYELKGAARVKKAKLSPRADFLYNRCADDTVAPADITLANGTMTLIDNNGDGVYDVLAIAEYETCVVKQVSADEGKIFGYLSDTPIDVMRELDREIVICDTAGAPLELNQIRRMDVVSCAASKNGRYKKLIVSRETVTGEIKEQQTVNGKTEIAVGDETYQVQQPVYNKYQLSLEVGAAVTLYLDFENRVAAFTAPKARYAYIYGAAHKSLLEDTYQLKTFESDGKWYERTLAEKVTYNGAVLTDAAAWQKLETVRRELEEQGADTAKWQHVAKIELNGRGEIDDVTDSVILRQGGVDIRRANFYGGNNSFTGSGNIGEDAMISGDTVVFFLPEDKQNLEEYYVADSSCFMDGQYFAISTYDISKFTVGLLVVDAGRDDPQWRFRNRKNLVVGSVSQGLNAAGDVVTKLGGYLQSRTYTSENTFDRVAEILQFPEQKPGVGVQKGDIVTLIQNTKGDITDARLLFDVNDAFTEYPMKSYDGDAFRVYGGYVQEYDPETKRIWLDNCPYHSMMSTNMSVYLFDTVTQKLRTFVASDIIPGDYVCVVVRYDVIYDVVVYRK